MYPGNLNHSLASSTKLTHAPMPWPREIHSSTGHLGAPTVGREDAPANEVPVQGTPNFIFRLSEN